MRELYQEEPLITGERTVASTKGSVGLGCILVLVANVIGLFLLVTLTSAFHNSWLWLIIGLVQAVYLLPIGLRLRSRGESATLQGLIIGAVITFLLCGACFGLVAPSIFRA